MNCLIVTYLFLFEKCEVLWLSEDRLRSCLSGEILLCFDGSERWLLVWLLNPVPSGNSQWLWSLWCHEVYRCCPTFLLPLFLWFIWPGNANIHSQAWRAEKIKTISCIALKILDIMLSCLLLLLTYYAYTMERLNVHYNCYCIIKQGK